MLPYLFDEPNWKPLEDLLPREKCGEFMWMGGCIGGIQMYKHIDTRHYLNIDNAGNCFIYNCGNYEKVSKESALAIVFDNYNAAKENVMVEFENNELHKALASASIWISEMERDLRVKDVVVHELYSDGFGSWVVKIYYEPKHGTFQSPPPC